ncbi:class I alpha-mannosidase protein [Venturia nashicola]|uniref:alpha-1,2-Mannosidase n=1 Tax=Venturia nashicola TaxID=86259 RepID=A0A4Z1PT52_9PEZI|nr:class I alpha-mannosidase protein [Venturia nashicola]
MGLHDEFQAAVKAIEVIDFSACALDDINVFETTIRYLGGFLAAYDLTGGQYPVLLQKAGEIGDMLYVAFDTPNRMPITRWNFRAAAAGTAQESSEHMLVAEIGSLTLEFTRLSQLTGDPRYFDAVQRIMDVFDKQQNRTNLPGMWPTVVNAKTGDFTSGTGFTIGGMVDSLYEYLPKQHLLLGGATDQYRKLFENALIAMKRNIFYRPMTPDGRSILLAGEVNSDGKTPVDQLKTEPQAQHLGCFAGGMVGIAAKIFESEEDLDVAKKLVEGCIWGYETFPNGIMPEIMHTIPCQNKDKCDWEGNKWIWAVSNAYGGDGLTIIQDHHLPKGVAKVDDPRYTLRPEAIESVFILYRITGDPSLRERAWKMFNSIIKSSITDIAHAALTDCMVDKPRKSDRMESFWMAETLKYFFLIFSDFDVVSLDEYVLNTEAHPLRRPT